MRPSPLLLTLAIGLLLVTCVIAMTSDAGAPLVQAGWAVLAFVALCDLILTRTGRSISVDFMPPEQMFVGEKYKQKVKLTSKSGNLPAGIDMRFDHDSEIVVGPFFWPDLTLQIGVDVPVELTCTKRGEFKFKQIWLFWPSRFRLFEIVSRKPLDADIKGIPNIQPVLSGEITTQVQAELYGIKSTQMRGEGSEFHQLREFTTGMDPRMIDWKRSARHGGLVARETHAEQNHQIIMCIDNGYLMREEIEGLPKIDRGINAALATTWAAGLGGDQVGFFAFDSRPRQFIPPSPGRVAFNRFRFEAAALKYSSVETNHTLALAHLNGLLNRRSMIVVFSDFVDSTTAELLVENMAVLSRHHLLIFVAMRDPALDRITNPEDPTLSKVAEAISASQISKERELVLDELQRLGVVCLDIAPDKLTPELVSAYLDIKAREMI
ncbi:Uncharacterized conserved protein, DUF58 family, contains vWF domain [Cognatiyoonia koreensis]|uniref:Uncharacterized conserved protein, DUF58 family, contains vWF domain n=1 Tax=Cognatiyoonia koreensis TaxID=364200 RepID=A0A1I0ML09_9RHOB|nr:DUF58 domain-containing protein [Cognatiyoonia koreensis]SEV88570.1 Uncharacterized conserved protein, DUF58 family, contains vWF domain [Cognatiyoonia koreensis]